MASVAFRLQGFKAGDQITVLARLIEGRKQSPWFTGAELGALYDELGVPSPAKIGNVLVALEKVVLVVRRKGVRGEWRLTPAGKSHSTDLLGDLDLVALQAETKSIGAPNLGHVLHSAVPTYLAPAGLIDPLRGFLETFPFDNNVFAMTRFPDEQDESDPDPVGPAIQAAKEACTHHGLHLHVADDRSIVDDLWMNVAGHMWGSRYGIAFFENRKGAGINYNLTIEVGAMLTLGRRCALLKDRTIKKLPTDLVGHIYTSVDLEDLGGLSKAVHRWLREDLALSSCAGCA